MGFKASFDIETMKGRAEYLTSDRRAEAVGDIAVQTRRIGNAGWSQIPIGGLVVTYEGCMYLRTCDAGFEGLIGTNTDDGDDGPSCVSPAGDPIAISLTPADLHGTGEGTLVAVLPRQLWTAEHVDANDPQVGDLHPWDALCETYVYVSRNTTGRVDGIACARAGWVANEDGWFDMNEDDASDADFARCLSTGQPFCMPIGAADVHGWAEIVASVGEPLTSSDECREAFNAWALEQPADSIVPALRP